MADSWARYLRQQVELCGAEVYLSSPSAGTRESPLPSAGESTPAPGSAPVEERAAKSPDIRWMKDAPPIPGPGLVVQPPAPALIGDQVAGLETLDALAAVVRECRLCGLASGRTNG